MGRASGGCKLRESTLPGRRWTRAFSLVGFVYVERNVCIVRILVANSPRMYRESLALSILRHRPNFEVMVASPEDLVGAMEHFAPHALVRDDDGAGTGTPDGVVVGSGS